MAEEQSYILAVDTATPCSSVAVTAGSISGEGQVVAEVSLSSSVTHSRRLLTAIDWLLTEAGIGKEQIAGYASGLGPGSFTGLRIGMATTKGLAAASGKPLYGLSTLDVIAAGCTWGDHPVCAVLDARKKEVYVAWYTFDAGGIARRTAEPEALSPESLAGRIDRPTLLVGDGLKSYGEYLQEQLGDLLRVASPKLWSPSAAVLGLLAGECAANNEQLDVGSAAPLYVRASDAELNLKRKP